MRKILPYILAYLLWIVTAALGFLDLIMARKLCLTLMAMISFNRWVAGAVDKFSFLIFGIIWLILVIFSEYYYRRSIFKKRLWQNFSLVTRLQLLFLFLTHLIPLPLSGLKIGRYTLLATGAELTGGLALLLFGLCSLRRTPDRD